ncbi:MAG: UvrB/UvrC motif-containing protein, partial [Paramuribaculum sp.]|nr:UvrB/UvrC motif-containing protein [Paramuribaculum sp.]
QGRRASQGRQARQPKPADPQAAATRLYDMEFSQSVDIAADPVVPYMNKAELERNITRRRMEMVDAAKRMDFMEAARLRDEVIKLEERLKTLDNESE